MPNLKLDSYQTQVRLPGEVETRPAPYVTPQQMGSGAAAGLKQLAGGIQDGMDVVSRAAEQSDVSDVNAKMAQARADYTKSLNEKLRTAQPGDKTFSDTFISDYDSTVEKLRDNVSTPAGQRAFTAMAAELRTNLYEKANAGQAELTGLKARTDYQSTLNNLSSSLIDDPSSFNHVLAQHGQALQNLVSQGLLPAAKAEELRKQSEPELAKSAVRGWIRLDPDAAEQMLTGPDSKWSQYIDGDQKHQLLREVQVKRSADAAEAERQKRLADEAKAQRQSAVQNDFLKKLFVDNDLSVQEVLDNKDLDTFGSGSKQQFVNMLQEYNRQGGKVKADPSTVMNLFQRIHLPDGDPRKITDENELNEHFGHGLDYNNLAMLRNEIAQKKTPEGDNSAKVKSEMLATAKDVLVKKDALGMVDPDGAENYTRFLSDFLQEWDTKTKAGTPVRNLIDPKSPDYMGNRFRNYQKTTQEKAMAQVKALQGKPAPVSTFGPPTEAPTPLPSSTSTGAAGPVARPEAVDKAKARLPNESIEQYLKRRGLK